MQLLCLIKPNSKIDAISVSPDGSLILKIKAPPVDGKANKYLVEYLSEIFNLRKKSIQITAGFTGSHKRINIVEEETVLRGKINKL